MTHDLDTTDYRKLAMLPLGTLLHTIIELDAPGLVPAAILDDAAYAQRELIVIATFKADARQGGPLSLDLTPEGRTLLRSTPVDVFLDTPGTILEGFASRCLLDPDYNFSRLLRLAQVQQSNHAIPPGVPSLGTILCAPEVVFTMPSQPLFDRDIIRAALIASVCLRALLSKTYPMPDPGWRAEGRDDLAAADRPRNPRSWGQLAPDLALAVRNAQDLSARVLTGETPLDDKTAGMLLGFLRIAERRFARDGFSTFADILVEFRLGLQLDVPCAPTADTTSQAVAGERLP
jgi:hypothetical protein